MLFGFLNFYNVHLISRFVYTFKIFIGLCRTYMLIFTLMVCYKMLKTVHIFLDYGAHLLVLHHHQRDEPHFARGEARI